MKYQELLQLDPEVLNQKYVEVFGEKPSPDYNKQQIASAISKALLNPDDEKSADQPPPQEGNQPPAEGAGDNTLPPDSKNLKVNPGGPKHNARPEVGDVNLEKVDAKGKVIDHITLKRATWNNLPPNEKAQWRLKNPDELKSNTDESKK